MDILLVRPCSIFKNNLSQWLNGYFNAPIKVTTASTLVHAREITHQRCFDLVIVKAGRTPRANKILQVLIQDLAKKSKVVVYAADDISIVAENPYQLHANGFISMWEIPGSLVQCLQRVMRGYSYQSPLFL